ncbi:DUF1007 family protein [Campylobacter mucosalis]|uniref:Nickel/cobalt efflux system n=1 Tax=Campylobacter mucosalis CCUG 21559 TaxID=1032067 RepID=A0A6G5QIT7_9BACT|nr:DUF1007 family protein [Campylobacter mucosalis]QCD45580.1 metal ion ABC transporter, permease protein [Campylobacter mucosalis CCUG 21559]
MNFLKKIIFLAIFSSQAFACALCSLYSPTAHVGVDFNASSSVLESVKFTWSFSENFSSLTLQSNDANFDGNLDENELNEILLSLLDYLKPNGYLLSLNYYYGNESEKFIEPDVIKNQMKFDNSRLSFEIVFRLNLELKDALVISASMIDNGGYFNFMFEPSKVHNISGFYLNQNSNANIAFFALSDANSAKEFEKKPSISTLIQKEQDFSTIDKADEQKFDLASRLSLSYLDRLKQILKSGDNSFSSLLFVAFFSFLYGLIHAAGPGHAKTLTSSYFIANGGSYKKALNFALSVGALHVGGSFLLVCVTFFTLENITKTAGYITSIFCGILIVCIATFMLFKKFSRPKIKKWSIHSPECGCGACRAIKGFKSETGIKLGASLVPCPGVIMVFLLAFEFKGYLSGIVSGVFMGLGMSVVIFVAAVLGAKINKSMFEFKMLKYVEILAIILMMTLGIFMIINAGSWVL